jgi:hypothetical protein
MGQRNMEQLSLFTYTFYAEEVPSVRFSDWVK